MQTINEAETPRVRDNAFAVTSAMGAATMQEEYRSVLFPGPGGERSDGRSEAPVCFHDLNLDQIVEAITASRREYNLPAFFYQPLGEPAAVAFRHEIMRDLSRRSLFEDVEKFSAQMRTAREHQALAQKLRDPYQQQRWRLEAADEYGAAVERLRAALETAQPEARGLRAFQKHLDCYVASERFHSLRQDTATVKTALAGIRYTLLIDGGSVTVCKADDEIDYGAAVKETFARFQQGAAKDYLIKLPISADLNHVEANILALVALRNPAAFGALDEFCAKHADPVEEAITIFEREIQFYLAYLEYIRDFQAAGLQLCFPQISDTDKNVLSRESYDLALARKLIRENKPVVCNDFELHGPERIFVVTGPNQGGKTTFARTFGQLHYLASLGCPVAGTEARLFLGDRLFTHFERAESVETLRGKLQDDLVRIHDILAAATSHSIVIMNEIFSSTSLDDATYLGRKIMEQLSRLDALGVCVTFLDELTALNEKIVSLVALVAPDDLTRRTHKLARRPADGIAHALALARKHGLTYEQLQRRFKA